jgi:serine/threonine protein phosphatase 1
MTRVAVVGDIHGNIEKLRAALCELDSDQRHIVFVGDYVNGGLSSADVIAELVGRSEKDPLRYTFLAGNHDLALLRYLRDGNFSEFAAIGGTATIHSYLGEVRGDIHERLVSIFPPAHLRFLEELKPFWDDGRVLISHVGFDPLNPSKRDMETLAIGYKRAPFKMATFPRELVVCGHYVQSSGKPYVSNQLICIDTGCGTLSGPLTLLLLPERRFISI